MFVAEKYTTRISVFSSGTVGISAPDELCRLLVEVGVDDDAGCDDEIAEDELTEFSDEELVAEAFDDCTNCIELSPVLDELPPFDDTAVLEVTDKTGKELSKLL